MIDAHSHITITKNKEENKKNIVEYLTNMKINGIKGSIVTVNPFIDDFKCPTNQYHYVKMKNSNKPGHTQCKCTVCQKIIYEGLDPFIEYNKILIEELKNEKNIAVYPVVSVTNSSTQWLIDLYKELYGKELKGIKAYTGLSAYSLDDLKKIRCDIPILVHSGIYPNQDPINMLKFISNYDSKVQIAHLAGLNIPVIEKLKQQRNVLIDISPSLYIYNYYVKQNIFGGIYNKEKISSVDDMYELLASNFDIDRIVWGSDTPYSNQSDELQAFLKTKVFTEDEKEKILSKNIQRALK